MYVYGKDSMKNMESTSVHKFVNFYNHPNHASKVKHMTLKMQ